MALNRFLSFLRPLFIILFLLASLEIFAQERMVIEITPQGAIDNFILDHLQDNLSLIFAADVYIGKRQPLPEYAYNKARRQYSSLEILKEIAKNKKDKEKKILAVINKDLYAGGLNFVFGQASSEDGICAISITRLYPSYYRLPKNKNLFLKRVLKETVHEIGHLLNLRHCPDSRCVMHFSYTIEDTDKKDCRFCAKCTAILRQKQAR